MTLTTNAPTGIDPHTFRAVLRNQASTVTVVTAPGPAGLTVTSFTSVSLNPQLVSFVIGDTASARPAIEETSYVAIHLLRSSQDRIARTFATSGIDRFADLTMWRPGPYGLPMLHDALAVLICSVTGRLTVGDHIVVVGTPVSASHTPGDPLLYHRGTYTSLAT